jgi:hypothetical protein
MFERKYVEKFVETKERMSEDQESILPNFFFSVFFFGIKLGHFTINNFFLYVMKMQAYQQNTEKFFVSEEKSLVGSTPGRCRFHHQFPSVFFIQKCFAQLLAL